MDTRAEERATPGANCRDSKLSREGFLLPNSFTEISRTGMGEPPGVMLILISIWTGVPQRLICVKTHLNVCLKFMHFLRRQDRVGLVR